jgi:hypothetical protein
VHRDRGGNDASCAVLRYMRCLSSLSNTHLLITFLPSFFLRVA